MSSARSMRRPPIAYSGCGTPFRRLRKMGRGQPIGAPGSRTLVECSVFVQPGYCAASFLPRPSSPLTTTWSCFGRNLRFQWNDTSFEKISLCDQLQLSHSISLDPLIGRLPLSHCSTWESGVSRLRAGPSCVGRGGGSGGPRPFVGIVAVIARASILPRSCVAHACPLPHRLPSIGWL